jgi:hypothetical protein
VIGSAKKQPLFLTTKCFCEKNSIFFNVYLKLTDNQRDMLEKNVSFFLRPDGGDYPAVTHNNY